MLEKYIDILYNLIIKIIRRRQKGCIIMKNITAKSLDSASQALKAIADEISALPEMNFSDIKKDNAVLIIVDVVNGFVREGAMSSLDIESIIPNTAALMKKFNDNEMPIVAFADCHKKDCAEFKSFPEHCVDGTSESELVDELKKEGGYFLLKKNSTNGFHEKEFMQCLIQNPQTNTIIVAGDCTDICVLQLCLTMKTWYTQQNRSVDIIVPVDCVETYDAPNHNGVLMNIAAYKLMSDSGIKFVKTIK